MKPLPSIVGALCVVGGCILHGAEPLTLKLWPDGPPSTMAARSAGTAKLNEFRHAEEQAPHRRLAATLRRMDGEHGLPQREVTPRETLRKRSR